MPESSIVSTRWLVLSTLLVMMTVLTGCRTGGGAPAPAVALAASAEPRDVHKYDRPGFVTFVGGGELWVFRADSPALARFEREGAPSRSITLVGAGPAGMNVRSVDRVTITDYLMADADPR